MQPNSQVIIQSENGAGDKEVNTAQDSEDDMEPDHAEQEVLLPPSSVSPHGLMDREPKDRFHTVYVIFLYLGVATLLPWNFFITAKQYFDFKFRNTSLPDGVPYNTGNVTTLLQTSFESYLSIFSMLSNLFFITVAMIFVRNVSLNCRMLISLTPIIVIFIVTLAFIKIDTDSWQDGFFWFTLASAALMVGLTAVLTGSIFGLSCLFPAKYTQAVMSGQALGGTLSAVVMIVATAIGVDAERSAFGFFLTATLCQVLALFAYLALYYMKFSRFFMSNQVAGKKNSAFSINADEPQDVDKGVYEANVEIPNSRQLLSKTQYFSTILKEIWAYFLTVSLVFFVTLACFPAIVSLIRSVDYRPGDPWTDTYFSPVICFLFFNLCDLIGRSATHWVRLPRNGQKCSLMMLAVLRLAFPPLFMMCNINPDNRKYFSVKLHSDWWPALLTVGLGLTNGYVGTLSMLYGPTTVDLEQAEGAGMVMTFGMTLGLAGGSIISLLLINLIS